MKLLFVKLGGLGDVIQAATAMRIWTDINTDAQVDWVVGSRCAAFVRETGLAGSVIEVDEARLYDGPLGSRLAYLSATAWRLGSLGRYDLVATAHADSRYRALTALVASSKKRSFSRDSERPSPIPHRNRVFEHWRLLSGTDGPGIAMDLAARQLGKHMLASAGPRAIHLPTRYVVMVPGGASNAIRSNDHLRRWPAENYGELAMHAMRHGFEVVLLGGSEDEWTLKHFGGLAVVSFIGRTSIIECLQIIDGACAFVSHDTGLLHLAALSDTPVIALFGPTPHNAVIPSDRQQTVVLHPGNRVACSPCYDGINYAPCKDVACMRYYSPVSVMRMVLEMTAGQA